MHCTRLNLAAIVAAIHIPRALGLNLGGLVLGDELAEGGSQFIRFNGTVESSFTFSTATPPCGDLSTPGTSRLEPLANSTLYVGANPSWDPNPWFFWLHGPVDVDITFRSAAYTCYKNGTRCSSYESWPWYYVREQILNISATSTQRLRGPEPGGAAGKIGNDALFYSAVADQSTFTGNGSSFILPGFSLLVPESVDASGKRLGCSFFQAVTWYVDPTRPPRGPVLRFAMPSAISQLTRLTGTPRPPSATASTSPTPPCPSRCLPRSPAADSMCGTRACASTAPAPTLLVATTTPTTTATTRL